MVGDGTILQTTNGGLTWMDRANRNLSNLYGFSITDSSIATAVGDGGTVIRTTDGGATWVNQPSGTEVTLQGWIFPTQTTAWQLDPGTIISSRLLRL